MSAPPYSVAVLTETPAWLLATRKSLGPRATIADVARVAGVHKGTVSRALRGMSGVNGETRERILQVANELDFSASQLAASLATGRSRTVGIILPTLRSWYFSEIGAAASERLVRGGYRVELIHLDMDSDFLALDSLEFRRLFDELGDGRGRDALLFAGTFADRRGGEERATVPAAAAGLPLTRLPGVFVDDRRGAQLAGEHLLSLGHTDIAVFDGRKPHTTMGYIYTQRTVGVLEVMRAAGLDPSPERIYRPGNNRPADGEAAMWSVLGSKQLPTAVFCHTDEMAFGALAAIRRAGLRCPADISVAAFDNHPMAAYWGLTTVCQHTSQQGVRAAEALIDVLEDKPSRPQPDLGVDLVVRESTGPPRDHPIRAADVR